jgi:hypothetical protein
MILGKFASEIFLPNRIIIKLKWEAPFNGGTYPFSLRLWIFCPNTNFVNVSIDNTMKIRKN